MAQSGCKHLTGGGLTYPNVLHMHIFKWLNLHLCVILCDLAGFHTLLFIQNVVTLFVRVSCDMTKATK